jgi:3-oxoacyl-[acyl-carrier-protein] synthase III
MLTSIVAMNSSAASSSRLTAVQFSEEWYVDQNGIRYRQYRSEQEDMADMMALVDQELSEP